MTCIEHYFENLLFNGQDTNGNPNKNALSPEVQEAIEICAQYITYTTFYGREDFLKYIERRRNSDG